MLYIYGITKLRNISQEFAAVKVHKKVVTFKKEVVKADWYVCIKCDETCQCQDSEKGFEQLLAT